VTYFAGGEGLPADEEAMNIWLRFLPKERILPFDKKANFWEMGETGPCGPCSEIHFDRLGGRDASALVNYDDPTVIEIWNIVFMQFNREPNGSLRELPAKHIDTGMGFERLTSILQTKMSNYDTDVFAPIFSAIAAATGAPPYAGLMHAADVDGRDMAYRVVGDHIRTLTFAITDGAVPGNEGRGYVLRRILRRAVRYGQQFLKAKVGFFSSLVPVVVDNFKVAFPELEAKAAYVQDIIKDEEESFSRTLSKGIKTFNARALELKALGESVVPGKDAFFLYDSMGFPLDLTEIMAGEMGLRVDKAGFEAAMAEQKARSQASQKFTRGGPSLKLEAEQTAWLSKAGVVPTLDEGKYTWFSAPPATLKAMYIGKDKDVCAGFAEVSGSGGVVVPPTVGEGEEPPAFGFILDSTSFYAESGGQVGDTGLLEVMSPEGALLATITVVDSQVYGGYVVHEGVIAPGGSPFPLGATVIPKVDYERRGLTGPNHTMTHVLNWALREVMGEGCDQRGSLVTPDKLRFDYATGKAPTPQQLEAIETLVSKAIGTALPVHTLTVPLASALKVVGLRAVFGEVYPDPVRVVSVGAPVESLLADPGAGDKWRGLSIEFCGGTHIPNTSRAGSFALTGDEALAKGIRRLTGCTREAAVKAHGRGAELRSEFAAARSLRGEALNAAIGDLKGKVDGAELSAVTKAALREEHSALVKVSIEEAKVEAARVLEEGKAPALAACAAALASGTGSRAVVFDAGVLKGDGKAAGGVMDAIRKAHPTMSLLGVSSDGVDKVLVFACSPKDAPSVVAKDWVTAVLAVGGGKGGGKDEQAQGTSKEVGKVEEMLAAARAFAQGK
jgi:alanyl-tRNA synthetase